LASRLKLAALLQGSRVPDPEGEFSSHEYRRHNQRRQEHLASLRLPLPGKTVLEVGAGIGDHTSFFIDRGCDVTTTDGRPENVDLLRRRYPKLDVRLLDLDPPTTDPLSVDVVYCYGLLYHLSHPEEAIRYLARSAGELLLLETCVSLGLDEAVNLVDEQRTSPSQAVSGTGCRPTRTWIWARLREEFEFVYATATQPWHEQFPLDWNVGPSGGQLTRAVFVAARMPVAGVDLLAELPTVQRRH
jgi:SAM-dependent methyltransferase